MSNPQIPELFKPVKASVSGTIGNVYIVDGSGKVVSDTIPEAYGVSAEQLGLGVWATGGPVNLSAF